MQLHLFTWPEVETYRAKSKAILIPIGSTEQHGPNGLLGADALCPEIICKRGGDEEGILVGPTFNVGHAQHHMSFSRDYNAQAFDRDRGDAGLGPVADSPRLERIYWLNGHRGNIAAGEKIVAAAVKGVISEFRQFAAS